MCQLLIFQYNHQLHKYVYLQFVEIRSLKYVLMLKVLFSVLFKPISDVLGFLPIDSNTLSTLIMSEEISNVTPSSLTLISFSESFIPHRI